jgi:peptidoglycan/xylan/chitin deacetylase (PgdA/CDA1 family)
MRDHATIYLMYHELEVEGRPLCHSEPGYTRYVVKEHHFSEQMSCLQSAGIHGVSVSSALANKASEAVVITFDDGCETDLAVAAPILQAANFGATFYITVGYLGRPGYMVPQQVRELSDAGFEIGCHSMTHPYLDNLGEADLRREIVDAKSRLEEMTGRPVHHFSCPGGRWTPRVAEVARCAGYHSVCTSQVAANGPHSNPFHLGRIAVMRGLTRNAFHDLCLGRGLARRQFRNLVQETSHRVLGNVLYDRLRRILLEHKTQTSDPS